MLDKNDYKEIAQLLRDVIDSDVMPKFDIILNNQAKISNNLIPITRVNELEEDVKLLKYLIFKLDEDIQQLKNA